MKIFLAAGCNGDYSDHRSWNVRAFLRKQEAVDFVNKLIAWANQVETDMKAADDYYDILDELEDNRKSLLDPHFYHYGDEMPHYYVEGVELSENDEPLIEGVLL